MALPVTVVAGASPPEAGKPLANGPQTSADSDFERGRKRSFKWAQPACQPSRHNLMAHLTTAHFVWNVVCDGSQRNRLQSFWVLAPSGSARGGGQAVESTGLP